VRQSEASYFCRQQKWILPLSWEKRNKPSTFIGEEKKGEKRRVDFSPAGWGEKGGETVVIGLLKKRKGRSECSPKDPCASSNLLAGKTHGILS